MNKSIPSVAIEFVPAIELITAAASVAGVPEEEVLTLSLTPERREEFELWRSRVRAQMSPFERSDLELVFSTITAAVYLFYLAIEGRCLAPDQIIGRLREIDDEQFVASFRELLHIELTPEPWLTREIIEEALENDRARESVPFSQEAEQLVELLCAPTEFRRTLADVLDWFHQRFLVGELDRIDREIRKDISRYEPYILEQPAEALDRLSGGNFETLFVGRSSVTIFPIYLASFERSMLLPGNAYIVCGTGRMERALVASASKEGLRERTEELLKTISDPNRLAILRLLRQKPRYGKELAGELSIGAPTASYHLDKLMRANLVRLELSHGRRFYYAVNPGGVQELQHCLQEEFLDEA